LPAARWVVARLLETARRRPELDIVIGSTPEGVFAGDDLPPNVHTLAWAPQRAVLAQAELFVTHAGLSSTREAILEGVPMIAIPLAGDARGNAARIAYHGLGERFLAEAPIETFLETVDRVLREPRYAQAVAKMRAQFEADAANQMGVKFIDDVLEGRIRPLTADHYENVTTKLYRGIMGAD
jgi:UDP:flavonoid glycosyltransferase YjiC (YdhE family)